MSEPGACIITEHKIESIPAVFVENNERKVKKVIFLFHRLLNDKTRELPLAYNLAREGYFVVVPDMYGHGDNIESFRESGKYDFNNLFRHIYLTAECVNRVTNYLKQKKSGSLSFEDMGAVGVSAGGSVALVAGCLVKEVRYAASIIGSCNWEYIVENNLFRSFRIYASSNPVIDNKKAKEDIEKYEPLNNFNAGNIKPVLFLDGKLDTSVPYTAKAEYYEKLKKIYSCCGKENYLEFKLYSKAGHEVTPEMTEDLIKWLNRMNQ